MFRLQKVDSEGKNVENEITRGFTAGTTQLSLLVWSHWIGWLGARGLHEDDTKWLKYADRKTCKEEL